MDEVIAKWKRCAESLMGKSWDDGIFGVVFEPFHQARRNDMNIPSIAASEY
ncbi:hypothetical protein [Laceyella tengchongensis]|uniref:hypothetical protein n=1 Tax=Laceyella tengchongensis TaxID=574699 RepID=UPI0012B6C038|nr:hypothetical protein [Laceyella tengchongensis]MRG29312.1 hypothetical protein [Laceyella tengchongensis]